MQPTYPRTRSQEDGVALILVIMLLVVVGTVAVVALTASSSITRETSSNARKLSAETVATGAIDTISQYLQVQGEVLGNGLTVSPTDIRDAATSIGGGTVLDGSDGGSGLAFPSGTPSGLRFTIRQPASDGGATSHWQVLRTIAPTASTPWVTIYVRAWTGAAAGGRVDPTIVKARLRPGTFVDFQVISDTSIAFQPGTTITGGVHSNGFSDGVLRSPISTERIWPTNGTVQCVTAPGQQAPQIRTAHGRISSAFAGCRTEQNTGQFIALTRIDNSFRAIERACLAGRPGVRCLSGGSAPSNSVYTVNLSSSVITLPGYGSWTMPAASNGSQAVLLDRDAFVIGTSPSNTRTTVATRANRASAAAGTQPATNIIIGGNVGSGAGAASLALMAEHDVIVDPTTCTSRITAALLAGGGAITIPREQRSTFPLSSPILCAGPLTISGSMVSHGSIILRWSWPTGQAAGFSTRYFTWNPTLSSYPPPYVPLSHPWETVSQSAADGSCISPTGWGAATCA